MPASGYTMPTSLLCAVALGEIGVTPERCGDRGGQSLGAGDIGLHNITDVIRGIRYPVIRHIGGLEQTSTKEIHLHSVA